MALILVAAPSASGTGETIAAPALPNDCPPPIPLLTAGFDVTAVAHIARLGGATLTTAGFLLVTLFLRCDGKAEITGTIRLDPAFGYFVAFRFVPATSLAAFQDGKVTSTPFQAPDPTHPVVDSAATAHLVLSCVRQGGVPVFPAGNKKETPEQICAKQVGVDLGVGTQCQAELAIPIKGQINFVGNGSTTVLPPGTFDIPRFSGCGTAENLDPLISGLVSGPGNLIEITLIQRCRDNECQRLR